MTPLIYPAGYRGARRALVDRFPYSIYFLVEGDRISVVSPASTSSAALGGMPSR